MSNYSRLREIVKKELKKITDKYTSTIKDLRGKSAKHKAVAAFDVLLPFSNLDENSLDLIEIFKALKEETSSASNTEAHGFLWAMRKDHDFIADLKNILAIVERDPVANEKYAIDKVFNFATSDMVFLEKIFKNNSTLDDEDKEKLEKNDEYIAFKKSNPLFNKLNLNFEDIQFIRRFFTLIQLKQDFIQQVKKSEKDESKQNIADPMADIRKEMQTKLESMQSQIDNVNELANKKASELEVIISAIRKVFNSQNRFKTLLIADGTEEANHLLALVSPADRLSNNSQGFFSPNNVTINFGQYILAHCNPDGTIAPDKQNFYNARYKLFSLLMEAVQSGTENEKSIFQVAIYYLLRFKYSHTIQQVFNKLSQELKDNSIQMPEDLEFNFKVFANQDELKESINNRELSYLEAASFYKFYTGSKTANTVPILPKDESAELEFRNLAAHLSGKNPDYKQPDFFNDWLKQNQSKPSLINTPK